MKDRISQNPGRVLVKPENGNAQFYATLERADNPIQEGDALNKKNLLTDETAASLGLGENAVPNDVFGVLGLHRWRRRTEESGYTLREETIPLLKIAGSGDYHSATLWAYDSLSINNNGEIILGEETHVYGYVSYPEYFEEVKGKYFCVENTEQYYFCPESATLSWSYYQDVYYLELNNVVKLTPCLVENIGEYEYVTSPNRHAYPDSGRQGIFTYEYLGSPLENAKEAYGMRLHWWKRVQVETGWVFDQSTSATSVDLFVSSSSTTITMYYSDSLTYDDTTGVFTLVNPQSTSFSGNSPDNYKKLANKYFLSETGVISGTTLYKGGTSLSFNFESTYGGYYFTIDYGYKITARYSTENIGEYEYVSSPNRNAYPDSGTEGIFSYQYLGVPFENAREGAKVVTGSYVGTGTYGASNPYSLTFDSPPKLLYVYLADNATNTTWQNVMLAGAGCYQAISYHANSTNQYCTLTWDGNSVSWYSTANATYHLTLSGRTYNYVAIL